MSTVKSLSCVLSYELKQHTPIIHFQHNQSGATLRATEVKPKLDKFIIKKLGGVEKINKSWFTGDTEALNYKMQISTIGEQKFVKLGLKTPYDIYYGNMGDATLKKKGVICDSKLTIVCLNNELRNYIDKYIAEFFVVTNFGTMQNKGFGSYTVKGKTLRPRDISNYLKQNYGVKKCYCFSSDKENCFQDIKKVYSVMKSGINFGDYHRSYLFEYCHEVMGLGNEKAYMKEEHISPYVDDEPVKHPLNRKHFWRYGGQDYRYVRSMLGIGENIEYITGFYWNDQKRKYVANSKKEKINIKNSDIERLASPIRFKIINSMVYIYADRINDKIFAKEFTFKNKSSGKSVVVKTPDYFDIDNFLEWFVRKYNSESKQRNDNGKLVSYSIGKEIKEV